VAAAQGVPRDTSAKRDSTARVDSTPRSAVPLPSDTGAGTARGDSLPKDSLAKDTLPKDTIKAPLARAEMPPVLDGRGHYHWDRAALFASGSLTLLDLLESVPGVTIFRSGWLASPQYAAYLGTPTRVRLFYDGMEIDPLDRRSGGVLDMSEVQLWTLEELDVERGADEVRVYMRSWRVSRTSPQSRTDVLTGDQSTNAYRGFFGKRYKHGEALQLAGQQWGTSNNPFVGGGDELSLLGRLGFARRQWSFEAVAVRSNRTRDMQEAQLEPSSVIPRLKRTRTDAYIRASRGDPDTSRTWAQLMVGRQVFREHSPFTTASGTFGADSADTTQRVTQYVLAGGLTRSGLRLSATERLHHLEGRTLNSLSARATYERQLIALSLYAERRSGDTSSSEELAARFTPLRFLSLSGAVTYRHGGSGASSADDGLAARGELELLVGRVSLSGGVMRRPSVPVPGLIAYDPSLYTAATAGAVTGIFGRIHGKFYQDLGVDVWGVRWEAPGFYRPQTQARSELYLDTKWLRRFPSGNFGFLGSIAYEYRSSVPFPTLGSGESLASAPVVALFSHTLVSRVEVRILDAVIFFHAHNGMNPLRYVFVPGFQLPPQRFVYGVRWEFWN
jgi:hypothetical protein